MRLFFAVGLEPAATHAVSALQRSLQKQASDSGLRWERPDHLHYTLHFLGEVDDKRVTELKTVGESAVAGIKPFPLELSGIGAFPTPRNPKVLWVGAAEGTLPLTSLATSLGQKLQALGFPIERRPFQPHLTIARVKGPGAERAASRLLESQQVGAVAATRVTKLVLMQSALSPHGSTYTAVEAFPLGAVG